MPPSAREWSGAWSVVASARDPTPISPREGHATSRNKGANDTAPEATAALLFTYRDYLMKSPGAHDATIPYGLSRSVTLPSVGPRSR
jgi:hypothetical protein